MALNLNNIPGKMISGLSTEMLNFVSEASSSRFLHELDQTFLDELLTTDEMDSILSKEEEEKLIELEKSAQPTSTKIQTKKWVQEFRNFLKNRQLSEDFERVPASVLNDYLRLFYSNLKRQDGSFYAPSSLICIRAAIHRHMVSPEVNSNLNILKDDHFIRANNVLKAMVKKYLKSGQKEGRDYLRIKPKDMDLLRDYFAAESEGLKTVQEECIFNILLHFQLRGRENLRAFTKDSFEFGQTEDGDEMVSINIPLLQKNVKASLSRKEFENLKEAKMVARKESRCPVSILKRYLSKLPEKTKDNTLFPSLKKDGTFSEMTVLGKETLGNLMSNLSKKVNLSQKYTNHCVRVTGINLMYESGMCETEIAAITGHKDTRSIQRYFRKNEKNAIRASNVLAGQNEPKSVVGKKIKITSNESKEVWEVESENQNEMVERSNLKTVALSGTFNNCTFSF